METVIFAGLLISGYLANQCNDNNANKNVEKKYKMLKKIIKSLKSLTRCAAGAFFPAFCRFLLFFDWKFDLK